MKPLSRTTTVLAGIAISVMPCAAVLAQQPTEPQGYAYGPGMMGGGGWYGMILGPLFMILAFAAVIAVAALLVRWLGAPWHGVQAPHTTQSPGRTPLDILKERYARGEIDKEEFEERRRVISE